MRGVDHLAGVHDRVTQSSSATDDVSALRTLGLAAAGDVAADGALVHA